MSDKEREEFEAWYRNEHPNTVGLCDNRLDWRLDIFCYEHEFVDGMFHAWQKLAKREAELLAEIERLKAGTIPDGFKLVPLEPTLKMVMAGEHAFDEQLTLRCDFDRDKSLPPAPPWPSEEEFELCARVSYRAMLKASPQPSQEPTND